MISKSNLSNKNICVVYTHHKLGDLIWQLPYIKAISDHHNIPVDLILRKKTQAKNILKNLNHINNIYYNDFRKGIFYWIDVLKIKNIFDKQKYTHVYILDKVNKPAIAAKFSGIKNIIGPGIGNQKKWLTVNKFLTDNKFMQIFKSKHRSDYIYTNFLSDNNYKPIK